MAGSIKQNILSNIQNYQPGSPGSPSGLPSATSAYEEAFLQTYNPTKEEEYYNTRSYIEDDGNLLSNIAGGTWDFFAHGLLFWI